MRTVSGMGIMEIAAPVLLCLGAICVAAALYGIVAAVKGRRERRRELDALRGGSAGASGGRRRG